jgi:purine-binding chemotaxis protein CheW
MSAASRIAASGQEAADIIAFQLGEEAFCVRTTRVREIRGWIPCMPLPKSPPDVMGVINLRGAVIPIVDLSLRLGLHQTLANERSAIIVTETADKVVGLLVDRVTDMLNISVRDIQPVPAAGGAMARSYAEGILTIGEGMIYFLDIDAIFADEGSAWAA